MTKKDLTPREIYRERLARTRSATYLSIIGFLSLVLVISLLITGGLLKAPIDPAFKHKPYEPTYYQAPCIPKGETPAPPSAIKVNVLNATETRGLANTTADALKALGVKVGKVGNSSLTVDNAGKIRASVHAVRQAYSLATLIPGSSVELIPTNFGDPETLELLIGDGYEKVLTAEEYKNLANDRKLQVPEACAPIDPDFVAQENEQLKQKQSPEGTPGTPSPAATPAK
ncbi:hypothetical protein BSR29_06850 [Boudabousia liubingyangii]|uniref:LytR/CpsA/Psr regulator C-terminal domain-containing protein n=1 Tax=Boudabousia liubingyangii TaxID=1921764 RepID=A0A1Q5PJZ2_9ACTO|nr:LytR C-terminal domain-containing protein [Boudabousia liubingyangii]OKL46544.1 hypothetical protein BSR29_06850 [Boudabousia liubingyangii]OKL46871.1 hypothetical protein BSR28_05440 [Boudabousia liubingyangii]